MCDLLDRLALDEVLASYPRNRLHDKHPQPPASFESRQPNRPTYRGSILDADPPAQGVNIAGRMTICLSSNVRSAAKSGRLSIRVSDDSSATGLGHPVNIHAVISTLATAFVAFCNAQIESFDIFTFG